MKFAIISIIFFSAFTIKGQDKPAYQIFDDQGKKVSYSKMIDVLSVHEIILLGEIHNNALVHWLELQVMKDLYEKDSKLVLGMEMFEADNQIILDEFLGNTIEEKHLMTEAKVWENYKTDYKPLVDFIKEKQGKVIATNIPRRYANLVFRKGLPALDSLNKEAKKWMVPLPFEIDVSLPGYKAMMGGAAFHQNESSFNLVNSQAIKDATMAHFILAHAQGKFLHINGSYHSQNSEGIVWYLKKKNPILKVATVHFTEQDKINLLDTENKGLANYIICIPTDMAKSY